MRSITCVMVFLLLTVSTAFSASQAERQVLPNGLVLLHSERTALPLVQIVLAVKAGSILDPLGKAGLSNLTTALLDEGTERRSSKEISSAIEFVGGSLRASGGADYITVTLSVLKKDLDLGLDLMSDIVLHPAFSDDEIARQKTLLKGYIRRQLDEPEALAQKEFMKALFGDQPYGWPVIGTEESLDALTRGDILSFHKRYYGPNNAIMAVAAPHHHRAEPGGCNPRSHSVSSEKTSRK